MRKIKELISWINDHKYIYLVLLIVPLFFYIAYKIVDPTNYANSDFFSLWLAGRFAFLGEDPYLTPLWVEAHHQFGASWISDPTFLYPLPLSLFFIPLGILPLYPAFLIWDTLTLIMNFSSLLMLLSLHSNPHFKRNLILFSTGLTLFIPTILTLFLGQLSGLFLFVLASIVFFWEKGKWWQGSILLPFLALKPNFGIPIIIFLAIYLLTKKKISSLFYIGATALLILLLGLLQNVNWISEFLTIGNTKLSLTFGFSPTVWGLFSFLCNHDLKCTLGFGSLVCLILIIGTIFIAIKKGNEMTPMITVSFAITVTLLITPYTWAYDQLLLFIPIFAVIFSKAKNDPNIISIATIFLGIDFIWILSAYFSIYIFHNGVSYVATPITLYILLVWFSLKK